VVSVYRRCNETYREHGGFDTSNGLRVFENGVLNRLFGSERDEVTAGWRKLQNEEREGGH
jgi:hypothetical protein